MKITDAHIPPGSSFPHRDYIRTTNERHAFSTWLTIKLLLQHVYRVYRDAIQTNQTLVVPQTWWRMALNYIYLQYIAYANIHGWGVAFSGHGCLLFGAFRAKTRKRIISDELVSVAGVGVNVPLEKRLQTGISFSSFPAAIV